jgi:hypothetical protein
MKTFNIWGRFEVEVDFDIEAENEKEAERKAKEMINDAYRLDYIGELHVAKSTNFNLLIDQEDEDNG